MDHRTAVSDDPTVALTCELVSRPSVTPEDAGCQALIGERLAALGFRLEAMPFGEVSNLWARLGDGGPVLCFAGHTDVVPTGPLAAWRTPPFDATIRDGVLYGRGAADMKGGLAAMVTACEAWLGARGAPRAGSIAFLLTSDEEGPARDGTRRVVETLAARGEQIDWCIVGEPSSSSRVGDVIRIGRRGSLGARLRVRGRQGHVAYPDQAVNPIHVFAPALAELAATRWDEGNEHFPPTTFQVSNIHGGTGATNVIPGELELLFNFRYCTESTVEDLRGRVESILARHGCEAEIDWAPPSLPYLSAAGPLRTAACRAVETATSHAPALNTAGGTSDGRFIAPLGTEVLELGPVNATIHQIDECVSLADLVTLREIYGRVLDSLFPDVRN
jgi:succinyl-diaminopimelate desuccinylase